MTARIGIAAIETVRPLPFAALPRPRLADMVSAISSFSRRSARSPESTKR
jgi:putative membrane protein